MQTTGRRVLRPGTVAKRLDISTSTLWQWVKKDPSFPRFFQLGPGAVALCEADLDAWIERRVAAQQSEDAPQRVPRAAGPGRPRKARPAAIDPLTRTPVCEGQQTLGEPAAAG